MNISDVHSKASMKASGDAKDCPYVNGVCPKGSCDMKAMKTADMKNMDCCKVKGAKAIKTSTTSKVKKSSTTTPAVSAGTN